MMMKKLMIVLLLFAGMEGLHAQNSKIIVEADKSLKADFSNYKTYKFAPQLLDDRNNIFFLNDLILKENVISAVEHELSARGYEMTAANPDMLINFRIFEKPTQIVGFVDPPSGYWGQTAVRELEDKKVYNVKAGTLMLSMVDRKTGQPLWQGFASGIMDNFIFDRKKERIDEAVALLFDNFKQRADDLVRK